ncbi:MAG: CBS domain-containing protein [Pseudomonadales bacterium]|nr:CBS domain-containing protein [Pseudomonadales bacterium]
MDVKNIMTSDLVTVKPDRIVRDVFELFNRVCYHHVPVVNDDKLVGIISDRDMSRNLSHYLVSTDDDERELMDRLVSDIMTIELVTIDKSTSIDCASILLLENNISCLPVVDDDLLLEGLLTWKDILEYYVYAS